MQSACLLLTSSSMDTVSAAQTAIEEVNGLVEANAGTLTDTVTRISEIDFEAAKKIAGSAVFSAEVRRKKFGGAV